MNMKVLYKKTSKEFINSLPPYNFKGDIKIIDKEEEVESAINDLLHSTFIGIDTETRPSFKKGEVHQVALLQLSSLSTTYLFRLNKIGFHSSIFELLGNPKVYKIGLALDNDLVSLKRYHSFSPHNFIDIQKMAQQLGMKDQSLQKLFANFFHLKMSKRARLSNWETNELSISQQRYAAADAYTCLLLYQEMQTLLKTKAYKLVD